MNAPDKMDQTELLGRLYDHKQKQLLAASQRGDRLLCQVLAAEAQAICDAITKNRQ
ncbi:hypothetical protein [Marinobacter mobilis]|uniref:Uncharacterized protein n=1 Tax=Marinobacter mobilis TaxID=488533 RepID=A0A1H2SZS4_9GAMM|nr:hypothetical protein [Marinobacter mobilis]SDW37101.1 hypothetical protein SAMN04487960_102293 [Marinobacter mobilis]